jgi:rhomboid family GlyGly-CTERM serine protease
MILKVATGSGASSVKRVLASLNCDGAYGLTLLGGCALLLILQLTGDAGERLMRYDRAGLTSLQLWRLLTAHVIHLDLEHAALNSLGLVLMWALFARDYRPHQWLPVVLGAIAAIDAGLWLASSTVKWYVGSSGALHGVLAAGTLAHLRRREVDGWLLCAFLVLKIGYEQSAGALPFADSAAGVVVDAHLYGVIGGLIVSATMKPAPSA